MHNAIIIGAGYVGLTLGIVAAESGNKVALVEKDHEKFLMITAGQAHFYEDGIDNRLRALLESGSINAYRTLEQSMLMFSDDSDLPRIFIITLGTPLSSQTEGSYSEIEKVVCNIAKYYRESDVLILRSTVSIGTANRISELHNNIKHIAFCPERTIEGEALRELRELPQIIGYSSTYAKDLADQFFLTFCPSVIHVSNLQTAETIKLISNSFRDLNFAFANAVAMLGLQHKFSGLEAIQAANASYRRNNIPIPGPVGGPCLEKDSLILCDSSTEKDTLEFLRLARGLNRNLVRKILLEWLSLLGPDLKIESALVCGLAFKGKPLTDDTRGSLAIDVVSHFQSLGLRPDQILGIDPLVVNFAGISEIFRSLDSFHKIKPTIIVICTNHELFQSSSFITFLQRANAPALTFWSFPDTNISLHKLSYSFSEGGYRVTGDGASVLKFS